jgi:polygalacturonase
LYFGPLATALEPVENPHAAILPGMHRARWGLAAVAVVGLVVPRLAARQAAGVFDVRSFGATGDGRTVDSGAINKAVDAAAAAGGGVVVLPAGRYLSFSIRLKSHVTLQFQPGAILVAADPASGLGTYDEAEPNPHDQFQDFGHSHWRNSLISAIDVEDVAIAGPGLIDGQGLVRGGPGAPFSRAKAGDRPLSMGAAAGAAGDPEAAGRRRMAGQGNKANALKQARRVTLRDFAILNGGHFAILATGVDALTIDNLRIDTNRDGIDVDASRNVHIANTAVNSPNDDAIVLKSSYALGEARPTENVTITNCIVSGYDVGSMLDGTYRTTTERAPDRDGVTGRIKLGTESNGGFRNVTVSNCVFDRSRGFAIETVDGGVIEDVTATNLTMRRVTTAPIFLRLGNRARGPEGTPVGAIRRVLISHVTASGVEPRFASIVAGLPAHPIEDVTISDVRILYEGGGTAEDAAREPPEVEDAYPEPSMFGTVPAFGLYVRHAAGLVVRDVVFATAAPDRRPPIVLHDAARVTLAHVEAPRVAGAAFVRLRDVADLTVRDVEGVADGRHERVAAGTLPR